MRKNPLPKGGRAAARKRGKRSLLPPVLLSGILLLGAVFVLLPRETPRLEPALAGSTYAAAPNFSLPAVGGRQVSLADYRGRNLLLFFHEGLGCPPCWQQNAEIERDMDRFRAMNVQDAVTIVVNPMDAVEEEYRQWNLTFPMLVDANRAVSAAYDVLKYSMHPGQVPGHTFFLIDGDGNIRWRKDYYIGGPHGHGGPNDRMHVPMSELLADVAHAIQGHPT